MVDELTISSQSNKRGVSRPLKDSVSALKKHFKGPRQRQGSCQERKRKVFPYREVIDLPSKQINDTLPVCLP